MENILSPSVLSADFTRLGADVEEAGQAGAKWVHLDVMDGHFVSNISIGVPVIKSLRKTCDLFFDVHLMITNPLEMVPAFAMAGADRITFHVEADDDPSAVIDEIRSQGKSVGITLNPATPLSAIEPYLDRVDMVLVMSVVPGKGGQAFIESSIPKIEDLVRIREDRGLSFDIEVDGGIKKDNCERVMRAGVNVVVAGSAVYGSDIGKNVRDFLDIFDKVERSEEKA